MNSLDVVCLMVVSSVLSICFWVPIYGIYMKSKSTGSIYSLVGMSAAVASAIVCSLMFTLVCVTHYLSLPRDSVVSSDRCFQAVSTVLILSPLVASWKIRKSLYPSP